MACLEIGKMGWAELPAALKPAQFLLARGRGLLDNAPELYQSNGVGNFDSEGAIFGASGTNVEFLQAIAQAPAHTGWESDGLSGASGGRGEF